MPHRLLVVVLLVGLALAVMSPRQTTVVAPESAATGPSETITSTGPSVAEIAAVDGEPRGPVHARHEGARLGEAAPPRSMARTAPTAIPSTGRLVPAPGTSREVGTGRLLRFVVEVEDGLGVTPEEFAADVEAILFDHRGWTASGTVAFQRVDSGPVAFRVTLASPATVDARCAPLRTLGRFSCWNGGRAMINAWRWVVGADAYGGDLTGYRAYLISHEVGHALGHGHVGCPGPGRRAPVMMQQSISVGDCVANPWPHPDASER